MEIYGLSFIYEWLEKNSYVLLYLGIFSFCIFFISIFGIKYFAAKIPKDYFTNKQRVSRLKESSLALWLVYIVIKNFKDNLNIPAKSRWPLDSSAPFMKGPGLKF